MKQLLLILLFLPVISFGQSLSKDIKHNLSYNTCDIMINQVLENTIKFIAEKNETKENFRFYLKPKKSLINWNDKKLSKWQISNKSTKNKHEKYYTY
mgnify:CR=1 FL=1